MLHASRVEQSCGFRITKCPSPFHRPEVVEACRCAGFTWHGDVTEVESFRLHAVRRTVKECALINRHGPGPRVSRYDRPKDEQPGARKDPKQADRAGLA